MEEILKELSAKIKFENRLSNDLDKDFSDMERDFFAALLAIGSVISFNQYRESIEKTLLNNFEKVSDKFKYSTRIKFNLGDIESGKINSRIDEFIKTAAKKSSEQIIKTTDKVARASVSRTIASDPELTIEEIAEVSSESFESYNSNRIQTISQTEVQNISEGSKHNEAGILVVAGAITGRKQWDARLDNKTRPSHAIADGQVTSIIFPFIVKGERLMYPGDTSLGASIGNTINCRCTSKIIA